MTFAARDFSPRRGVSDEHIPQWICEERATKPGRKRPAALRVAPNLACGFVARRLQPHGRGCALLAPRHRPNWAQRTSSYLCLRPLSGTGTASPTQFRFVEKSLGTNRPTPTLNWRFRGSSLQQMFLRLRYARDSLARLLNP